MAIINKNEFFTYLAKHGCNNSFAEAMLNGTVPSIIKYQFDSTYEWETEYPIVKEMLGLFVEMGIVPKEMAEEVLAHNSVVLIERKYDISSVAGNLKEWVAFHASPNGATFTIDGDVVTITGTLPLKEIA